MHDSADRAMDLMMEDHRKRMPLWRYNLVHESLASFRDDPRELWLAVHRWQHEAITLALRHRTYPVGLLGLTQSLGAWCDLESRTFDPTPFYEWEIRLMRWLGIGGEDEVEPPKADAESLSAFSTTDPLMRRVLILLGRLVVVAQELIERKRGEPERAGEAGNGHALEPPENLSPSQKEIWRAVVEAGHRMSKDEIAGELRRRGLENGDSALKGHLATMTCRLGVFDNTSHSRNRSVPRGYGLPAWP